MTHLLLLDDHTIVRNGLKTLLNKHFPEFSIDESDSVKDAMLHVSQHEYDLLVLDYQLQDGNALDLIKILQTSKSRPKVIILTAFDDEKIIYQCIQQGVQGILLKTSEVKKIIDGITIVLDGSSYFDESIMDKLTCYVLKKDKMKEILNPNECKILQLLSKGLGNREIADAMFMSEKTIRNYLSLIYEKIGVKNRMEAMIYYQEHLQN